MRALDLFSGIGGFSLGLERAGMETAAFCETDEFCRKVLAKHWPQVPCYGDIRELTGAIIEKEIGPIDLICGGFPCQPFSVAGKQQGVADDRYLWPEMLRIIREVRPRWVVGENVAGIVKMVLDQVLADLEDLGYSCQSFIVPACAVDAPHQRKRVWIVAHAPRLQPGRQESWPERERAGAASESASADVAHTASTRRRPEGGSSKALSQPEEEQRPAGCSSTVANAGRNSPPRHGQREREASQQSRWLPEPNVGRVAHGVPQRVDRLRSLGNAVVPQVVEILGRAIVDADE